MYIEMHSYRYVVGKILAVASYNYIISQHKRAGSED